MDATEKYVSPDGTLRLLVFREHGDVTIGFEGYGWHTHGDVVSGELELIGEAKLTPEEAARRFLTDLLADRVAVCIHRRSGRVEDVSATYLPSEDDPYKEGDESLDVRTWSGGDWRA